jgi:hypothetical protein
MTTTETCRYRGYDIVPTRQWSSWCVGVHPTRADLPLFRGLFCIPWLGRITGFLHCVVGSIAEAPSRLSFRAACPTGLSALRFKVIFHTLVPG